MPPTTPAPFTVSTVEAAALAWLAELGGKVRFGPDLAPDGPAPERADHRDVILEARLRAARCGINPTAAHPALDEAARRAADCRAAALDKEQMF